MDKNYFRVLHWNSRFHCISSKFSRPGTTTLKYSSRQCLSPPAFFSCFISLSQNRSTLLHVNVCWFTMKRQSWGFSTFCIGFYLTPNIFHCKNKKNKLLVSFYKESLFLRLLSQRGHLLRFCFDFRVFLNLLTARNFFFHNCCVYLESLNYAWKYLFKKITPLY